MATSLTLCSVISYTNWLCLLQTKVKALPSPPLGPLAPSKSELSPPHVEKLSLALSDPASDVGSITASILHSHYSDLPPPSPIDCIRLLLPHVTSVPEILTPPLLSAISSVTSSSDRDRRSRQMLPLLMSSPAPGNFLTFVESLPYSTSTSEELQGQFEGHLARVTSAPLTPSERSDAVLARVKFGDRLLDMSRSNVSYVREEILRSPSLQGIAGGPSESLELSTLDLRCCAYKGEPEAALNILHSVPHDERTEEMYARALESLSRR